ncbi:hypothetical protein [Microbacterium pumilum]|uniref:Uncharacterized protein n=1 Tax=Microbacterium pumilum TaxID=344165 RepID=A0ABN2SP42_9MICO
MSTTEQPATPPLTRKQMREIRNTGSNAIVSAEAAPEPEPAPAPEDAPESTTEDAAQASADVEPPSQPAPAPAPAYAPVASLARAAEPVVLSEPPVPDASVDLGVSPLTRRQARQQERIRTASVPVITPEIAAAYSAAAAPAAEPVPASSADSTDERLDTGVRDLFGLPGTGEMDVVEAEVIETEGVETGTAETDTADPWAASGEQVAADDVTDAAASEPSETAQEEDSDTAGAASDRAVVSPTFGAELLAGDVAAVELPPSFDQLLSRSSGTGGTPHALIMSQATPSGSIVAPVTATGEVLITGTLNLPEGLGSNGHAPGSTDGKEVDASLIDGELPAHSSPTPIAASAAISTVKNSGEIIKPPAPEKGSKLMLTLAITAGVLALALVGVLILAFVTGVFR